MAYQCFSELSAAGAAVAHVGNRHFKVLRANVIDVLITKVAVQNRKVLNRAREDIIGAEGSVAKANVLGRRLSATAPLTFNA